MSAVNNLAAWNKTDQNLSTLESAQAILSRCISTAPMTAAFRPAVRINHVLSSLQRSYAISSYHLDRHWRESCGDSWDTVQSDSRLNRYPRLESELRGEFQDRDHHSYRWTVPHTRKVSNVYKILSDRRAQRLKEELDCRINRLRDKPIQEKAKIIPIQPVVQKNKGEF